MLTLSGSKVLLVSPTLSGNAVGRAFSLWLLFRELGCDVSIVGPTDGPFWPPLAGSAFADCCRPVSTKAWGLSALGQAAVDRDLLVAVKALPASYGMVRRLGAHRSIPWILDIDDPDLEFLLASLNRRQRLGLVRPSAIAKGAHPLQVRMLARQVNNAVITVSNPSLRDLYGQGTIVPHVREPQAPAAPSDRESRLIAFIGTPREHKGVALLREAVASLHGSCGYRLLVTGPPPANAEPHEDWIGAVPFAEAMHLLEFADVVAIPSLDGGFPALQLPVKVIDAMMCGRLIVAADLPPLRWALQDTGLLFQPGSHADLARQLEVATDPALRRDLGAAARKRALATFTPTVVAPSMVQAIRQVMGFRSGLI